MTTVTNATHINLTYSGNGKFTATWKAYSGATVRRSIYPDQAHDTAGAALAAGQLFVDWSNKGLQSLGADYAMYVEEVILSQVTADRSAIALRTQLRSFSTTVGAAA